MEKLKNFTVYKSSAGSGKTFTLVKEYLKLALKTEQSDRYRKILAITFTNKATAEMKERIIESLTSLASSKPLSGGAKTMATILIAELDVSFSELKKRADNVLKHILHHYSDFSISTIDKFVHKIVRTFAHDLKIPMNFEVELDGDRLITTAVDQLLAQAGKNKELTKVLVQYIESKTDEEKSWHIEEDIYKYAFNLLKEEGQIHIGQLKNISISEFFKIKNEFRKKNQLFEKQIKNIGIEALALIDENQINPTSFAGGANGIYKYFSYLVELKIDKLEPTKTIIKNVEADKWTAGKCPVEEKECIGSIQEELSGYFYKAQKILEENYSDYILLTLINNNIYGLAMLNEIEKVIEEIKKEENIIHISEFNKKIAQIVLNEPTPFIYERLGERYANYLIDEFQDTSELQFQNLLPLIDNSLAYGNFNMLVGDGKQAIYRWRGGEVEQFSSLPNVKLKLANDTIISERAEALKRNYNPQVLDTNYRSKVEIIEFNNWFFEKLKEQLSEKNQLIYENQAQKFNSENSGGGVQFFELEYKEVEKYYEDTLEKTLEIIRENKASNYQYKDITILTRNNKDANEIANYLVDNNVPVISSESLLLENSLPVKLIIAVLNYLINDKEPEIRLHIANSVLFQLEELPENVHEVLKDASSKNTLFITFLKNNNIDFNKNKLIQLSLYEVVESISRVFNINRNNNPYVLAFLEFTFNFSAKRGTSIVEFIEHWEQKKGKQSIAIPPGENAVTLMTIHKSKGLQFPVVIFPFATWKMELPGKQLWINTEKEPNIPLPTALIAYQKIVQKTTYKDKYEEEQAKVLLDNFNLLYVAFTRPEDRLYVITGENKSKTFSKTFLPILKNSKKWDEEESFYKMGVFAKNTKETELIPDKLVLKNAVFNHWKPRVEISLQAEELWDLTNDSSQKDYGKLLHFALSKINTKKDVASVLQQLIQNGEVAKVDIEKLKEDIDKIISDKQLESYFSEMYDIKNEAEIILKNGTTLRPDRVMIKGKKAIVLDYKTGLISPKHQQQVKGYMRALSLLKYENIEGFLYYTEGGNLVAV